MTSEEKEIIKNEIDTANKIAIIKSQDIYKELLNSEQLGLINEVLQYAKSRLEHEDNQDGIITELVVSNLLAILDTPRLFDELLPEDQMKLTSRLRDYLIDQVSPNVKDTPISIARSLTTKNMLSALDHLDIIFPGQQTEYHFRITETIKRRILHKDTVPSTQF